MNPIKQLTAYLSKLKAPRYKLKTRELKDHTNAVQKLTLTYLCPNSARASGGAKVIYHHVAQINRLFSNQVYAQILHPKNPKFRCQWPTDDVAFKNNLEIDSNNELIVVNELWAARDAHIFQKLNIRYAIFVQNGYYIHKKSDAVNAQSAFDNASIILSVSDDVTECITTLYPQLASKILRLNLSVVSNYFNPYNLKENVISYMPRKLKKHSDLVINFVNQQLPSHWKIKAIDGLSHENVIQTLNSSKIFLSFSEFEGLGLPPVEAALCGNFVIGYTGEAGKEYWYPPIFSEVHCGNILNFSKKVIETVRKIDQNALIFDASTPVFTKLMNQFSTEKENESLNTLINTIIYKKEG